MPSRRPKIVIAAAVVLVVGAGAAIPITLAAQRRADRARLTAAADAFARAWSEGRLAQIAYAGVPAAEAARQETAITAALPTPRPGVPATVQVTRVGEESGGRAVEQLRVSWDLGQGRTWRYDTSATLRSVAGAWQVAWSPAVVHPLLTSGAVFGARRVQPVRGEIKGAGGQVLVTQRPVVQVGIQPGRTTDRRSTSATVARLVGVDAAALTARVLAAKPDDFVDVITLRRADYDALSATLQPIPGTVFRQDTRSIAPTAGFARALLGTVGPATKEIVDASKGRVRASDITGLSGVQLSYDERLSGVAGLAVTIIGGRPAGGASATASPAASPDSTASPSPGTSATGAGAAPLYTSPPQNGQSVTLTIDPRVQEAAEAALAAATKPAALVAIRPSTGEILAIANGGPAAAGYNRALLGQYPPGSTFKVATAFALLQAGLTPTTPVACPPTVSVGGRTFANAEKEVLGTVPFQQDFAQSCNTAFVGSHAKITGEQLQAAAQALGYEEPNALGVGAFMGSVPATDDAVQHAASMIGQAKVLASPLSVATVSASVAAGHHVIARLVTDPAPAASPAAAPALPQSAVTALRAMMREVVVSGTASVAGAGLRTLPGLPVSGKTGTAEFGTANPPQTHAWFTGFQGDLAFATVVEDGGFGAKTAAPLIADFLRRLQ